ncbi:GalNAc(5)-diNAcBac-PP-undecaprenol beta-1,3-glucosyltransferase [Limihaloglobus sulfuriphilus]|uniref:GalNAc(5)-diNAcBac-PP-undecaprenol beta-1,3-glucosyltransferase n=1 Tax=Limihaloglobus sulfuriphilus TaxID=1851148 RepID=A0A1Q2MFN3_9BACT|nr:glycosyltransferase family 2 protein [Limihaloglobus sulfuriphilus]AQQ71506.1 GalNAc(5)-diNAcBac-PP-undecaprenol beta-1,3-glucosyltransferase [Limihaloglobus sulfuriphilus]
MIENKQFEISIIIPTYNRPNALKRAVRSVIRQCYKNWQLIVVNDGDDMGLPDFFLELNDERVVYSKNKRTKGGNGARNTGALLAKSDYIAFLDDDDEWHKEKLSIQVKHLAEMKLADCSIIGFSYVSRDFDCETKEGKIKPYKLKRKINLKNVLLGRVGLCASSTILIRKSFFVNIGMFDEHLRRHQDLEFMLRVLSKTDVHFCDKNLVFIHGHNEPSFDKLEIYKKQYWDLAQSYLMGFDEKTVKQFYANEYRSLAIYAARDGIYSKLWTYLKEAVRRDFSPSRENLRLFYYIAKFLVINK